MNAGEDGRTEGSASRRCPRKAGSKPPKRTSSKTGRSGGATPKAEVPIIGVGASAGGVEALKELLEAAPAGSGLAFLVVQHLDPEHESQLASVLARHTALRVLEAGDGLAVEPDTVYTIPPGQFMGLKEGRLQLFPQDPEQLPRMSVDFLFRSLADALKEKAICVVLSGSGADGTLGLRMMRGAGGLAVVQDPGTAQFDSMPRSAIATGLADFVLPPTAIVPAILNYVHHAYSKTGAEQGERAGVPTEELDEILQLLLRANADFRGYKPGTLLRRIHRRMSVNRIGTLAEFTQFLQTRPDEVAKLAKDILIAVTAFFRDPQAYEELRKLVLAPLVQALPEDRPVRVWVAGCSTGEEAYSVAMLVLEELRAAQKDNSLQLFASDLDEEALAVARAGVYSESIAADLSPERLARFFTRQDHSYRVNRELRDAIVFSAHNLVADPPFTRMDLVSCRNVLIYLGVPLQQRLISIWSFALRAEGALFLGPAEGLDDGIDTFETISKKWRIYRRTSVPHHEMVSFPITSPSPAPGGALSPGAKVPPVNAPALAQRALLGHFSAALVLIDRKGSIFYFQGNTAKYLRHPTGGPDLNLFTMAQEKLLRRLRAAVRQVLATKESVIVESAPLSADGNELVNMTVVPVGGEHLAQEQLLAIIFEEVRGVGSVPGATATDPGETGAVVEQLETELRTAREELLLTAAEHTAATEELRAAHEEAISMNEELHSTNEELETSKEELQSVNEELTTLNTELQDKIQSLNEVNSDLANLFVATDIATLYLDRELRVRRFTPSATQVLNLIPTDVGRPVSHISQRFHNSELASKAEQVLCDLSAFQTEVETLEGRCYLMRILPYRDVSDRIEGVVVTFTDITALKHAEQESQRARVYAEQIVATAREPLLVLDAELRVVSANPAFYRIFRLSGEEVEGLRLSELSGGRWATPNLVEKLSAAFLKGHELEGFEIEHEFPEVGRRVMVLNAAVMEQTPFPLILLAMEDITEERKGRKLAEMMATEVSHRTKNGLAIVAGLLEMQMAAQNSDAASKGLLRDTITRIRSFAALHEQLQVNQSEEVELVEALQRIAGIAQTTLAVDRVDLTVEGLPVRYSFQIGSNLCVVASELIINALKHGGRVPGGMLQVRISVAREDKKLILSVWNSGNPIAENFNGAKQKVTGLGLVTALAEEIYGGEFDMRPHQGWTLATVILPEEKLRC